MEDKEILAICNDSNVTLKSTFKNSSMPVNVVCNECGLKFPAPLSSGTIIRCPVCSDREKAKTIEDIVKIDLESVEKTKKKKKLSKKFSK